MMIAVELEALDDEYAITLLPPDRAVPDWVNGPGFVNVSRCSDELSIVTPAKRVPDGLKSDKGWRALKLTGQFPFDQPGVVLSVVRPISENGLAVFVVSTFHRDYLLVRCADFERIRELLVISGHKFS
jgi:uncharacterized protein